MLGALPLRRGETEGSLEQRRFHVLPAAGALPGQQCGVDADRREVRRRHAQPWRVAEDGTLALRARGHVLGDLEVGEEGLVTVHVGNRAAHVPTLLVLESDPRGHERFDSGPILQTRVPPVRADAAHDEPGILGEQRVRVDPEARGGARCVRLDEHVSGSHEREEHLPVGIGPAGIGPVGIGPIGPRIEVELDAAAPTEPDVVPGCVAERGTARRLDLDHVGAVVAEQHAGDGTRDSPREIQHADGVEDAHGLRVRRRFRRRGHGVPPETSARPCGAPTVAGTMLTHNRQMMEGR